MYSHGLAFVTSVKDAVDLSLQQKKPLLVYCTADNDDWLNKWMTEEFGKLLSSKCIILKLVRGEVEYAYFEQIWPSVPNPSICCLKEGKIAGIIEGDCEDEADQEGKRNALQAYLGFASSQSTRQPDDKSRKTLKEESAQRAARAYQENITKQRKIEKEERERIRQLVKADREEFKAKGRLQSSQEPLALDRVHDNIKDTRQLTAKTCTLQIRLLNGHAICHEFGSKTTLNSVRRWVDENRNDGDAPYIFFRSIPRQSFQESDELKSLSDLQLTPRSALILKPIEMRNNDMHIVNAQGPGLLGRMYNSVRGWWNSGGSDENDYSFQPATKSSDEATSATSSKYHSPANSPYMRHADPSDLSLPSRPVSPNVFQFVNVDDESKDKNDRKTFNGNSVKLEDKNDEDDI